MIWPFRKRAQPPASRLVFKSGQALFEYQCEFGDTDIQKNKGVFAIVQESPEGDAVRMDENGVQTAFLRIASPDGGFLVVSQTAFKGDKLTSGDCIIWVAMEEMDQDIFIGSDIDPRFRWIGRIAVKVAPEIGMPGDANPWKILCRYDKPN